MIFTRKIGDATVTNFIEYTGPTHDPYTFYSSLKREEIAAALAANESWMAPHHWVPGMSRLVVTIQIWVVQYQGKIVIIDTGVGNRKQRAQARMDNLNTLFLPWLDAIGAAPDKVTHVVNTHLHQDHVGWNTQVVDGVNRPTFPSARYLIPRNDFEHFKKLYENDRKSAGNGFGDSVMPVVDAGLVDFIDGPGELADGLTIEQAHGHTPGMVNLYLNSKGQSGAFCADLFHSPLQMALPDLNSPFCVQADAARKMRRAFLERVADTQTLVMPMHFGVPFCGYARRQRGGGYMLEPAKLPA